MPGDFFCPVQALTSLLGLWKTACAQEATQCLLMGFPIPRGTHVDPAGDVLFCLAALLRVHKSTESAFQNLEPIYNWT